VGARRADADLEQVENREKHPNAVSAEFAELIAFLPLQHPIAVDFGYREHDMER
jgi:hypothetical protein